MMEAMAGIVAVCGLLIISQLSPGPDVIYVVRTSLSQGFRAGSAVALGITLGFFIQTLLVCSVGAWAMEQSWSHYVLWGAACWLLYLAWKIFPRHWSGLSESLDSAPARRESYLWLIRSGFLCNILNPKCTLFIMGLTAKPLSLYGGSLGWYTPTLVIALLLASQSGWMLWSGLLQWQPLRHLYVRHSSVVDAFFALMLAVFAVGLLLY